MSVGSSVAAVCSRRVEATWRTRVGNQHGRRPGPVRIPQARKAYLSTPVRSRRERVAQVQRPHGQTPDGETGELSDRPQGQGETHHEVCQCEHPRKRRASSLARIAGVIHSKLATVLLEGIDTSPPH